MAAVEELEGFGFGSALASPIGSPRPQSVSEDALGFGADVEADAELEYEGFVLSELEALDSILDLVDLSSPAPDEEPTEFGYGDGLEDEFDGFGGLAFEEPASPPKIVRAVPAAADKSDVGVAGPKAAVPPPPGPDKVLSTSLSPKFPKASQAFQAPESQSGEPMMLTAIAFHNVQMVERGSFLVEIRDERDGLGACLCKVPGVKAKSQPGQLTVVLPVPLELQRGVLFHLYLELEKGKGSFRFEVALYKDLCHDGSIPERYRFCVDQYSKEWIYTKSETAYALMFGRSKVVQDPQRGEKSNFLSHTKTSNKQKGTLARKITMRKGSNVRFFVLDADSLAYFNDVDGKELGRMSVADIQHVHTDANGQSKSFVVQLKSQEHVIVCKSVVNAREWVAALRHKLRDKRNSYGDARNTQMMF